MLTEVIDGPIGEPQMGPKGLAKSAIYNLAYCYYMQVTGRDADVPVGTLGHASFRLASWVEQADSRFGHALALSAAGQGENQSAISSRLYTIDRETRQITEEPKIIRLSQQPNATLRSTIQETTTNFHTTELHFVIGLLGKVIAAFDDSKTPVRIDRDTFLALADSELHVLQQMFPDASVPESARQQHVCEAPEFQAAAYRLFKTVKPGERLGEVCVQKSEEDSFFAAKLVFEESGLYSAILLGQDNNHHPHAEIYSYDNPADNEDIPPGGSSWTLEEALDLLKTGVVVPPSVFDRQYLEIHDATQDRVRQETQALTDHLARYHSD